MRAQPRFGAEVPGWSPLFTTAKFGLLGKSFLERCALLQLQLSQDDS